ncbi:Alpha-L-arabinofuranosidase 2 [Capsicum annuum]|uniref:Alpha-L-arabinofuranosidase 2 n=1 Tax=Capsicum annuum TaxID=4072 RepID=A0A2G2Y169_CAPAN|nr:Alpha-L-arabinofuranosidase 2 [Capsicum annuum]
MNHAGSGGLWAELVSNRGFESGGSSVPSLIKPWDIIGNDSSVIVSTDLSSCFDRNKVALRMEVLSDNTGANICPDGGVGVYNPGFWGMNIEQGKSYKLVFYLRSDEPVNLSVALTGSNGLKKLATTTLILYCSRRVANASNWTKVMVMLEAEGTDPNSRLELKSTTKGVMWFDRVSLMPLDTYNGHGLRKDLFRMLQDLKPAFLRFPGGCYVEGVKLKNAFRWKETVRPWEERPGHFNDRWSYWTDDGLGHFEFLQLAEDLGVLPVWVFNSGISHEEQVNTSNISPFVQDTLDGIEFSRGASNSTWVSVRAAMGHPEPFDLRYVAVGNEILTVPCFIPLQVRFSRILMMHRAVEQRRAFISEYATKGDAGNGNLLAALAEAGFLIGVERTAVTLNISISGLENSLQSFGAAKTIITSSNVMDENSFADPKKIAPVKTMLDKVCENMDVVLLPYSITSIDLLRL